MSIRTIRYTVTAAGITPATVQKGGLQGEHRATTLRFEIDRDFRNNLDPPKPNKPVADKIYYSFEAYTSTGLKNSTTPVYMDFDGLGQIITLEYPLENWLTRDGGNIRVYLIFSGENVDDAQTIDLYTYPALLRLDAVPDAEFTDGENHESISLLSVSANEAAERAENAADAAEGSATAADEAREQTESARFALEKESEFVFLGGDSKGSVDIELVVDEEISGVSINPVQNKAIAAAINAAKDELKSYTDNEIATFDFIKIVESLGETGLPNRLYLVPKSDAEGNDLFDEYIWADNKWEFITTKQIEIDLTPYVKREEQIDYIVEQGTSGIWTYRKWNSGVFECWGESVKEQSEVTFTAYGSGDIKVIYLAQWYIDLPFTSYTVPICSGSSAWHYANWVNIAPMYGNQIEYTRVSVMLYQERETVQGQQKVQMYVKGTWK